MLTPDELEKAGELVAAVYAQIEAEMLDFLARKMIEGDVAGQRAHTALLLLAQSSRPGLERILEEHGAEIDRAVRKEVTSALKRSDEADLACIKEGLGVELPALSNRQIAATAAGVWAILERHNLQMEQAAADAFVKASAEAVTQVNAGTMTADQALHRAVRKLERDGISIIQYQNARTGAVTVANKVDVAVRRHVRTQIAQDGARLTELRMDQAGVEFVEVSSHTGARPSHQEWEGRVYSRNGRKVIGGVVYEDFRTACHWGDVADGIYGANCRHSHGPYVPGMPRTYEPSPKHPSGLSNDEVYELNQKQRAMERRIRETKRELRGAELLYKDDPSPANVAAVNECKERLRRRQAKLREHIDAANARCKPGTHVLQRNPRREWAGDMPRANVPTPAKRTLDEFLAMPSVEKRIKAAGTSRTAVRKQIANALADDALPPRSFRWLTAQQQRNRLDAALPTNEAKPKSKASIFLGAVKEMATDEKLYLTAQGSASWAAEVMRYEEELLGWVTKGYESARDHRGKQAILVISSRGKVTVGADALTHIVLDHPEENGRPRVTIRGIIATIEEPLGRTQTTLNDRGEPSYRAVGPVVTVAINPEKNEMVTAWPTSNIDLNEIGFGHKGKGNRNKKKRR